MPPNPAPAGSTLTTPTVKPTPCEDRIEWRGDVGLFPTRAGIAYREFPCAIRPKETFGEGLLAPHEHHRKKTIVLPLDPARAGRAELLIFGNGLIKGPTCNINGADIPLRSIADFTLDRDEAYPTCSYSVNRSYSFADLEPAQLRAGENAIEIGRCHAFLQTMVLRLFEPAPVNPKLRLVVERPGANYELTLEGADLAAVAEVQFFARHRGIDMEGSGREVTWQAALNKNSARPEDYDVTNHCGSAISAPWSVSWDPNLVPGGPIQFRCRVKRMDGVWMESPGGLVELEHAATDLIVPRQAEGFAPWGFHVCGANQDVEHRCEFRLVGPDFHAVSTRKLKRAVLALPLYGTVDLDLRGRHGRLQLRLSAPLAGYFVRHIELPVDLLFDRMNHLRLKSSGETGCFQGPGPVLYMIYDQ